MAQHLGGTRYRLDIYNVDGKRINGTGSPHNLAKTRRFAYDILRLMCSAASIEISTFGNAAVREFEVVTLDSEEMHDE